MPSRVVSPGAATQAMVHPISALTIGGCPQIPKENHGAHVMSPSLLAAKLRLDVSPAGGAEILCTIERIAAALPATLNHLRRLQSRRLRLRVKL